MVVMTEKRCSKCRETKPLTEFWRNRSTKDGYQSQCKPCHYGSVKANIDGPNREHYMRLRRDSNLRRTYGITADDYDEMVTLQGGRCWICHATPDRLVIDHNHACCPGGKSCGRCIRALLCGKCNKAIGLFGDDPERMMAAADYVTRSAAMTGAPGHQ